MIKSISTYFLVIALFFIQNQSFSQVKQNEIIAKDVMGYPNFIKFKDTKIENSMDSIQDFLKKQYKLDNNFSFKSKQKLETKQNNLSSQKLTPFYKGIKIGFNEIVVISETETVKTLNGKPAYFKDFDTVPKLTEKIALEHLLQSINATKYAWQDLSYEELIKKETNNDKATHYPTGELIIINQNIFNSSFKPRLTYRFEIYTIEPLSRSYYYVDASNGLIVLEDPIIKHASGYADTKYSGQKEIETQLVQNSYRLRDYSRGNGIETFNMNSGTNYSSAVDFFDSDNYWSSNEFNNTNKDNAALDAHWGAEMTYDYFFEKHSRNSFDDNGSIIKSYVHFGSNYENAFWDGQRMTYGDGHTSFDALTSIDVVAHEIAHGICSNTANLIYQREPGAINEGLSDIWGAMVEFYADPNKTTYEIGEEITLFIGPLRSLSNPKSSNQPDTYQGLNWINTNCGTPSSSNDYCGVHVNSGVLNYWFYLLAEGGNGTNDNGVTYNISGIGKEKASKIVYRAENTYFTSTTDFAQARLLTIQAAEDLYGDNSIESSTVCQSWHAVGVGDDNCPINIKLNGNSTICSTNNYTYYLDDMPENSSTSWSVTSNLQIVNSSNSSITIKALNSYVNNLGSITASIGTDIIQKNIWIGAPKMSISENQQGTSIKVSIQLQNGIIKDDITTHWSINSSSGLATNTIDNSTNSFSKTFYGYDYDWYADIVVSISNDCGFSTIQRRISPTSPSAGECDDFFISNNTISMPPDCPMSLDFQMFNLTNNNSVIDEVTIFDMLGRKINNYNNFNLEKLNSGIYIIEVRLISGKVISKKIRK